MESNAIWGVDFDREYIQSQGLLWRTVAESTTVIAPGVWMVTDFPRIHDLEEPNPRFMVERNGRDVVDDFSDEVMLVLQSAKGLVLVTGCSHPGILNMIDTVRQRFNEPIHALIGGIHLFDASETRVDAVVAALGKLDIAVLGVSHCTGEDASRKLRKITRNYFKNDAGVVLVID